MFDCLQHINHSKRQCRFYTITLTQTLFGEACVSSEWGRIGSEGQILNSYFHAEADAVAFAQKLRDRKERRGFVLIPVQLPML